MPDEWDVYPDVPPPPYPLRDDDRSAEELAALTERIRKDYEWRCAQAHRDWLPRRVELVRTKIAFLGRCQQGQAADRRGLGCVYLMRCPSFIAYKIGYTDDLY